MPISNLIPTAAVFFRYFLAKGTVFSVLVGKISLGCTSNLWTKKGCLPRNQIPPVRAPGVGD